VAVQETFSLSAAESAIVFDAQRDGPARGIRIYVDSGQVEIAINGQLTAHTIASTDPQPVEFLFTMDQFYHLKTVTVTENNAGSATGRVCLAFG
tara:strand:- start:222 stop:503 length:282 start_codon:yes stop_codon:yes gene_type:complete